MKRKADHCLRQNALTLALAAPLAVIAQAATAQTTVISSPQGTYDWTSGNLSVTSTISGSIVGGVAGCGLAAVNGVVACGSVGTLTNSGVISGIVGFENDSSTITAVNNSGQISGQSDGIVNQGSIGTLTNSGTINSFQNNAIFNLGSIGTLTNNGGTISIGPGTGVGIVNGGTITVLNNNGGIISANVAVNNSAIESTVPGTIGTLTNSGMINGAQTGIKNAIAGTIGTLINSGVISGPDNALYNGASGSIGLITNSGMIAGNITNLSSNDLSISGGTGTIFGTLTGFGGGSTIGTITNTSSNVAFGSGNLLLNDNVNVGSNAVSNTGTAVLQVNRPVTITGNYNQGAGATLQIGVASGATTLGSITDTGYGRLVVTGNSMIASGSSVTLQSNGFAFAAGQRYVVVDTAGTAVYNPGSLNYSINGYTSSVTGSTVANGSNSDLVLNVLSATLDSTTPPPSTPPASASTPNPALIATAPNAVASLNGLLSYTGISDPALLNLRNAALGSLSQGSAATANRIGKQLAPPTQSGTAAAAPTFDTISVVSAHVDGLRLAQANGDTGVATGEGPAQWGVWGQAFGGHASQNERDQVDGYNANYGGLLLGVDHAINDNWRTGGVFSYSNTSVNNTGDTIGDTTTINGYGLIGYASYTGSPWYVNLSGGVVQQQYDTTRAVNFQGFSGTAGGHFSGQQYVARAEAGYPLALGGVTLTPLASLTYSYQDQGSYTESGGNGAALSVGATHANSVKSALGAKLEKAFASHYGEIEPDLQVQWIHEYDHTAQATGASFAGDPTGQTAFTTVGATPVSDLADVSLGVTLLKANNLSLSVRYELQAASGFVSQTGTVRVRQLF
ncbi:autotransporter domain-containing protein [Burkholderia sp. L27(2015)]|uniref:autotransporter outer membrane beta-barrel domain-containing protein n=1 Tax=Burkholderia sp. L27(2015) TaxID=1641858 RepID=UPI00131B18DD|nr:autotransporter domain-containing protein [Burkholderia sp. L27(2015)]